MVKSCCDSYHTQFSAFPDMLSYHEKIRTDSRWERTKNLEVAALDKASPLFNDTTSFDSSVSRDAIEDTAENLKLAIKVKDKFFPLRDTAYKSLLDRAKVGGSALPKLPREKLAELINWRSIRTAPCCSSAMRRSRPLIPEIPVTTPCWRSISYWTAYRARWTSGSRATSFPAVM